MASWAHEVRNNTTTKGLFENHKVNFRRQRWEITKGGFQKLQDLEIDFDEGRCLGKNRRVHMIWVYIIWFISDWPI